MRAFRFRVWDSHASRMIPPEEACLGFVFPEGKREPTAYLFNLQQNVWRQILLSDVMQSTARRDRRGNEVFEGDTIDTSKGRLLVVKSNAKFIWMSNYAIPRPDLCADPGSRVLVISAIGKNRRLPPITRPAGGVGAVTARGIARRNPNMR